MSTVTNRGTVRWNAFEGAMNADILIDFTKRLIRDATDNKVFLTLDNLKVHHDKVIKTWLAGHADEIEVFDLPSLRAPFEHPSAALDQEMAVGQPGQRVDVRQPVQFFLLATQDRHIADDAAPTANALLTLVQQHPADHPQAGGVAGLARSN